MPYADFDGRELVKALKSMGFSPVSRKGSHVKLRYEHPVNDDDIRVVTVPLTRSDQISQDTYRSIAEQCGSDDFGEWIDWIENAL